MAQDRQYIIELAETTTQLFARGLTDPSASEIAHQHFGDRTLGGEIVEGVRSRLGRVRRILAEDGLQLCPLGRTYYTRFRKKPPATRAEARRCLPLGHGMQQEGLHLLTGSDDLIWQEWLSLMGGSGAGALKRFTNETLRAVEAGKLGDSTARELLAEGYRLAQPEKPEIAARLMQALPTPEDEVAAS